jgi:hypothetical protein
MPEYTSTLISAMAVLISALIGAIIGSIGAVIVEKQLEAKAEESSARANLVQRYLFQLQDSVEALWYRLNNLAFQQGRFVMENEYFEVTTLYALGRVLAMERILALEGVYPQVETRYPTLGQFLKERRVDLQLHRLEFYQYDRIALAEAVIEREEQHFRASTYLEFRRRYEGENSCERRWLTPAREAVQSLTVPTMSALLDSLQEVAVRIAAETKIPSSLTGQRKKVDARSA